MAFYLIILIGIFLILFNYNAIKKEHKSFNSILNHEVDNMDEFKVLLGENNEQFNQVIFDIRKELEDINGKFNSIVEMNKKNNEITVEKVETYDKIEDNKSKINTEADQFSNNIKINEISDLIKQGFSIEDIAGKLNIGKGEVLLIKELYIK
ncbi:MAG: hypothetical protein H7Y18_16500 [Clostridiaceae bacterium]|nr:hypothetical protein [Clostridiaceae bacterium]